MLFYIFLLILALAMTAYVVSNVERHRLRDKFFLGRVSSKTKKRTLGDFLFLLAFLLLLAGIAIASGV